MVREDTLEEKQLKFPLLVARVVSFGSMHGYQFKFVAAGASSAEFTVTLKRTSLTNPADWLKLAGFWDKLHPSADWEFREPYSIMRFYIDG